jgi:DNA (cytosine-5)-methyltransferase 1
MCLNAKGGAGRIDAESETFVACVPILEDKEVAHALRADGFDASEDGTGRGTPIVAMAFSSKDYGADVQKELSPTLRAMGHDGSHANAGGQVAVCFDTMQITSKTNRCDPQEGDPCHPLASGAHPPAIAFRGAGQDGYTPSEITPPLCKTDGGGTVPTVFNLRGREGGALPEFADVASLRSASGGSSRSYVSDMAVRRLTPREAERLQGFSDDYTLITHRGKPAADGPRYKALGNSMAVPVLAWIGERIRKSLEIRKR